MEWILLKVQIYHLTMRRIYVKKKKDFTSCFIFFHFINFICNTKLAVVDMLVVVIWISICVSKAQNRKRKYMKQEKYSGLKQQWDMVSIPTCIRTRLITNLFYNLITQRTIKVKKKLYKCFNSMAQKQQKVQMVEIRLRCGLGWTQTCILWRVGLWNSPIVPFKHLLTIHSYNISDFKNYGYRIIGVYYFLKWRNCIADAMRSALWKCCDALMAKLFIHPPLPCFSVFLSPFFCFSLGLGEWRWLWTSGGPYGLAAGN